MRSSSLILYIQKSCSSYRQLYQERFFFFLVSLCRKIQVSKIPHELSFHKFVGLPASSGLSNLCDQGAGFLHDCFLIKMKPFGSIRCSPWSDVTNAASLMASI